MTPKRADEIALMRETVADLDRWPNGVMPIGTEPPYHRIGMHPKRAAHIHRKWLRWGWCDFGVSELYPLWLGIGPEKLRAALAEIEGR